MSVLCAVYVIARSICVSVVKAIDFHLVTPLLPACVFVSAHNFQTR